jgi:transcriptional regulator with GAF, ATPase, and Fis domain
VKILRATFLQIQNRIGDAAQVSSRRGYGSLLRVEPRLEMKKTVMMVGVSAAIRGVEEEIHHAARCDAKVLITGESGAGKEIVARLIHERSGRGRGPLVTINCAGFPDSLLESELFGHMKGSFTDAHRDKRGWLETANGGTIFMDEVGEMSPAAAISRNRRNSARRV